MINVSGYDISRVILAFVGKKQIKNIMKPHTTILLPVPFQYKGAAERAAAIRAKADKDPRVQATREAIERGNALIEQTKVKIEESKKLMK